MAYIRKSTQVDQKTGHSYSTYRLVENYRNSLGKPRQRTLLNLGTHYVIPGGDQKRLADRIEEILQGQSLSLFTDESEVEREAQRIAKLVLAKGSGASVQKPCPVDAADYQHVDVDSLSHQDVRFIGAEAVCCHVAEQMGLSSILRECGFNEKQIDMALGSIIARLISPGSERSTHWYLTTQSALDELLKRDFSQLPLHGLYRIADQLLRHKTKIETALYQREVALFNLEETITLYDLTNTYFEGRALKNAKAKYGRSKEKRSDCCLVALGMVLDGSGFPKKSKIYEGNISEPKTFKEMLKEMSGEKRPTVVMDAGIATEANLAELKQQGYTYIVVSRKKKASLPEGVEAILLKSTGENEVRGYLTQEEEDTFLYCHSEAKAAKSANMKSKFEERFEAALAKLNTGLSKKGCTRKYDKVMEHIGRLKQKYTSTAKYYEMSVTATDDKAYATAITYSISPEKKDKNEGVYCLRSNREDLNAAQLWGIYTMLTELEAAFRHLKSELGLRPIYHRVEGRVDAHLFISILAYHLLHTIRTQLKQKGIDDSWNSIRDILKNHIRLSSTKLEDGRVLHIRKNTLPSVEHRRIYQALDMPMQSLSTVKQYR